MNSPARPPLNGPPSNYNPSMTIARDAVEAAWLESLPDILASCAGRWKLRIGEPLIGRA